MKLVFATNNCNKLKELQSNLGDTIDVVSLKDIGCNVDIPETGSTLEENAYIKSSYVYNHYGLNCFADDTGFEIDSLNGVPGVYSARYAGENKNSDDNMKKVLQKLKGQKNRDAQFRTIISLWFEGKEKLFEGIVRGTVMTEKHGDGGFGYDPIFMPEGYNCSFAEMSLREKNAISHRGIAVRKLIDFLLRNISDD
ncbi:MAG: non-canonical purine NTP diphosphatase [Prolixibacteraceae bacterium]|nr:non-canonical purine NTP diphosphatase [Prolixibacteraceae bacterium]